MSRELKILELIKLVDENPYKLSVFKLSSLIKLPVDEILALTEKLNLEVLGHRSKNKRREIEKYVEYNPNCTAKELMKELDVTMTVAYDAVKKIGVRLSNDWIKREVSLRKSGDPLVLKKHHPRTAIPHKTFKKTSI